MTRYRNRPLGDHSGEFAEDHDTPEDAGRAAARRLGRYSGATITKAVGENGIERDLTDDEESRAMAAFEAEMELEQGVPGRDGGELGP